MICLYDRLCTDYTGNGLAVLLPTACTVTEEAGGQWEASCTLPVTDDLKSRLLERGRVLKMQKEEANFQSQLEHTTNALEQADFFRNTFNHYPSVHTVGSTRRESKDKSFKGISHP